MAEFFNLRRKIEIAILLFLILIAFATVSSYYWIQWTFLSAAWGFLTLVDLLFLSDDTFVYDPNYKSWGIRTGTERP